jgi:tetratricopeptide (TPR) repeat protein
MAKLTSLLLAVAAFGGLVGYKVYRERPASLLARGSVALERGNFDEAGRLAQALEDKGQSLAAHLLRGKCLLFAAEAAKTRPSAATPPLDSGLLDQALAELSQNWGQDALGSEGAVLAARCLIQLNRHRAALEKLQQLVERDANNGEAHRLLAAVHVDLNDPAGAVEEFRAWARLDPENGLPYRWIGFFKKDSAKVEEAITAYQDALARRLTPDLRAAVLKELAELKCVTAGEYQEALDLLAQGPGSFADDPDAMALRIECLRNLPDRGPEAVAQAEQGLRQHPEQPRLLRLRAQLFLAEEQQEKALPLLEQAVKRDPYDLEARMLLVDTCRLLKKDSQAEQEARQLKQAQDLRIRLSNLIQESGRQPWNDRARLEVAGLFLKMNRTDDARTWLRAAVTCNPSNQKARDLLNGLPAGQGK